MGKLDVSILRSLDREHFRVLTGIEMGMKNHELVPEALAASLANLSKGGLNPILRVLCQNRLVTRERGKRFDGYRLTNLGYDYLALKTLSNRDVIHSFGHQIGVGKESNIYIVANECEDTLCLKLHRLGRTCFRKVTEKRDYKHRKSASWLYLSRISATKEFAYLKALHDRDFPVPEPIDRNRHCVIMQYIDGTLLNHVNELKHVDVLYDALLDLILRFGNSGVIHGDFNEFNIILDSEDRPIIIDFPQMISIDHPNAEFYFDRDVKCIRSFFKKRFRFETDSYPRFSDICREDNLDRDVFCSGFTKKMDKDIITALKEDEEEQSNDEKLDDDAECRSEKEEDQGQISGDEDRCISGDEKLQHISGDKDKCILKDKELQHISEDKDKCGIKEDKTKSDSRDEDTKSISSYCESTDDSEDGYHDSRSVMTAHTVEIEKRITQQQRLKKRKQYQERKRCVAKGDSNAVRRKRKENSSVIKQYKGWDF